MQNKDRQSNKSDSRFVAALLALVLAGLVGIGALVVYVDPFFHYHAPLKDFPYLVDNQLSQNPGMARHMDYDSVMLGSSMTVNFDMSWFEELLGQNTIKLSYSGAFPRDQKNIMDIIFASHPEVETVYLGIDVITYTGDVDQTKYEIPEYLYDDKLYNDISYVWNKDVLLNYILRPLADPDKTDLNTVYKSWWTDDYYNIQWVMHNYTSPEYVDYETKPQEYVDKARANLETNLLPYIEGHPNTEFVIFFPPYSILFWNDVLMENHMEATIEEYRYLAKTLAAYDNVKVFFFPSQEWIITDLNNYADYSHYHPRFNRYMTECFADGTCQVDEESIDQALDQMRQIVADYDFEALFSVDY